VSEAAPVAIRQVTTIPEYLACQDVQRKAFRLTDDTYVVPVATLVGANLHGGLVHAAFQEINGKERLIGFSFAFLGRVKGKLCLYSQITAVDPDIQAGGVGTNLKNFQRDWARDQGISVIAWAFDPLQSMNAHLNLNKLGATVVDYVEDMYGPRTDGLSRGVPSDRLIVEWPTTPSPRYVVPPDAPAINATAIKDGVRICESYSLEHDEPALLFEIPDDIVRIKQTDEAAGLHWNHVVRAVFEAYLARGYTSSALVVQKDGEERRCFYLFHKDPA